MTKKILLIDDEEDIREILKLFIGTGINNEIIEAASGNEGIQIIKDRKDEIGIILCDYRMDDGNGGDVYNFMKEIHFQIPYIMASTDTPDVYPVFETLMIDNPRNGSIKKPFKKDLILEQIKKSILD